VNESLPQQTVLERLGAMAATIALQPIQLEMPPQATNRTLNTPFFICQRDIFEVLSGTDMLCISVIQLWLL